MILQHEGYEVVTAESFDVVEGQLREAAFDLVIVAVKNLDRESVAYSKRLRAANAKLPILALSDNGLFLPKESLVAVLQGGHPLELIAKTARMLLDSTHVRNNKNHKESDDPPAGRAGKGRSN
jgi:DNA-binding NtrC family response regulator